MAQGAHLDGEADHAAHAVGEAGHLLPHPQRVGDDHQADALKPALVAAQHLHTCSWERQIKTSTCLLLSA